MHFLGHSTLSITVDGVTVLTDPVLRSRVAHIRRREPVGGLDSALTPDAVLISHLHLDHLDLPSLTRLGRDRRLIVPVGAGRWLRRHGFERVEEIDAGGTATVGGVTILGTRAKHSGFRPPFGPRAACIGFVVGGSRRIYFAGDTDLFAEMAALENISVALLPVWGWGRTLGPGHLNPRSAAEALRLIRPAIAVPIHWGSMHPLGAARWSHHFLTMPPHEFAAHARQLAAEVDVRILQPGAALDLPRDGRP